MTPRKKRSDAGIPRRSTLNSLYDTFADQSVETQDAILEVLEQIHHQRKRGAITAAAQPVTIRMAEKEEKEETE